MELKFDKQSFWKRLKSMLKVDFRRMFTMNLFYIMLGIAFVVPVLILVMTTMMDGTTSVNPSTGVETTIEGFDNVWQIIGTISSSSSDPQAMMGLTTMCNINMMFFMAAVLVCIFVSDDFRSGYSKNLFTVRSVKSDYVISKTLVSFVTCASLLIAFFIGAMLGGKIAGLPFDLEGVKATNILMCMLAKVFLVLVFVSIYLVMSVVGKQKLWMSMLLALGTSMLLFTMVPMITPLDANALNVILCLVGGIIFAIGIGAISNIVLKKSSLV